MVAWGCVCREIALLCCHVHTYMLTSAHLAFFTCSTVEFVLHKFSGMFPGDFIGIRYKGCRDTGGIDRGGRGVWLL